MAFHSEVKQTILLIRHFRSTTLSQCPPYASRCRLLSLNGINNPMFFLPSLRINLPIQSSIFRPSGSPPMAGFWSTLVVITTCVLAVDATQVMHRPDHYDQAGRTNSIGNTTPSQITKRATGKTQFAYFTNWGVYKGYNFSQSYGVRVLYVRLTYGFSQHPLALSQNH